MRAHLPADHRAYAASGRIGHADPCSITLSPDESLRGGRHQFAMGSKQRAVRSDRQRRACSRAALISASRTSSKQHQLSHVQ